MVLTPMAAESSSTSTTMVVQQVDFIHIKNAAMGGGQQAGLHPLFTFFKGIFQVQGAHHAVFGGSHG